MTKFGCVVTSVAYVISRWQGKDFTPGQWLAWLNTHNGFVGDLLKWEKVNEYTKNKLVYTTNKNNKSYTLRNVWVMGANRAMFSHWVVRLAGGYIFDPLTGNVLPESKYPPVWGANRQPVERHYLRK